MTTSNSIFNATQRELLTAILNRIVPADGNMPGAGDLGVADFIEGVVSANGRSRRAFLDGLVQIELAAHEQGGPFTSLSAAACDEALRAVEAASPAFLQELVTQSYRGYYTNQSVFDLLQYRAPNRAEYDPKPLDESLLEPVRQRGPIWVQPSN